MPTDFKKMMAEHFGENLTPAQLWALVKFAKNVRRCCRNNAAFNNFMNATFPHAHFKQVTKTRVPRYPGDSPTYPGLQITVNGQTVEQEEGEE